MKLIPRGTRILVTQGEVVKETEGGLSLPQEMQGTKNIVEVLAIGSDCSKDLEVGQKIYFDPRTGTVVEHEGQSARLLEDHEVLAIVK